MEYQIMPLKFSSESESISINYLKSKISMKYVQKVALFMNSFFMRKKQKDQSKTESTST